MEAFIIENSVLLVIGTVGGLLWANLAFDSYDRFAHLLHFTINDVGMVFFFAIAAKEVFEATLPGGPLSSMRAEPRFRCLAPLAGWWFQRSCTLLMARWLGHSELMPGWAIPCATDVAFSYLVARFVFRSRQPRIARPTRWLGTDW